MKKHTVIIWVGCGVACALLAAGATVYSVLFNDSRLVAPMDFSRYAFRPQDLPMIAAVAAITVYGLALFFTLFFTLFFRLWRARRRGAAKTTRQISPKLGALGLLGFLGMIGFWSYPVHGSVEPFLFFIFFGFFSFYYEGKMSGILMDERYRANAVRAQLTAYRVVFAVVLLALLFLCRGRLFGSLENTLAAVVIVLSLALAAGFFLPAFLLYRYDHDEADDETGYENGR